MLYAGNVNQKEALMCMHASVQRFFCFEDIFTIVEVWFA